MCFLKGVDVSMVKELEGRGARYSYKGEHMDLFRILELSGVNLVRLRLWNHPYDKNGTAYGGGTNDLQTTLELAKRVVGHNMNLMLDFHYSDFWADPAKQVKPKAWEEFDLEQLKAVVYQYTLDTLRFLQIQNTMPAIVQIGNEITNGFLWPDGRVENTENMVSLLQAGIKAVSEIDPNIKILLHLDFGTDNKMYRNWFKKIEPYHLEFDMIGMSYYPYWNGSLESLIYNMNDISKNFGKEVLVAETAIGYTTDNYGCRGVIFSEELEEKTGYEASKEGQEAFLRDLYKAVKSVEDGKGVGVLYWEPEWLPIPECTWATQIGCSYMHDTAEVGNSWGNQALFDAAGDANPALINIGAM